LWNHWILSGHRDGAAYLDHDFVAERTGGFDDLDQHLAVTDTDALIQATGLDLSAITEAFDLITSSKRMIICWAMGITQHLNAVETSPPSSTGPTW